jgi:4-amino-4-deoxy-L-arabinose transferase-like glycosyltransferase
MTSISQGKLKFLTSKPFGVYILSLLLCLITSFKPLPILWVITGSVSVFSFFYYLKTLWPSWSKLRPALFQKKLFRTALIIRVIYVIASYFFYLSVNGNPFEYDAADSQGYHGEALWLISLIDGGQLDVYLAYIRGNLSDFGYVGYLSTIYTIFGENIFIARLLKALMGAYLVSLVCKLASRNFGENTGRLAGIMCMLSPNLIYYCGMHLKEAEMVFLLVFFLERADYFSRKRTFDIKLLFVVIALGISLFLFRTVLGAAAMAAFVFSYFLQSSYSSSLSKKIALGFFMLLLVLGLSGGSIEKEVKTYWGNKDSNQEQSMAARVDKGNTLAKYGSTAIFAPLILIAPFPTLVNVSTQQNQMLLNGGYFVKTFLAIFALLAILFLYKKKKLSEHSFILLYLFSYLGILAMSKFAISERFHLPILPVFYILAAYGFIVISKKQAPILKYYYAGITIMIVAWNIFKLTGRG